MTFYTGDEQMLKSHVRIFVADIVEFISTDIFLEEANLVYKLWAEKMNMEGSLSEDNELVQISMRMLLNKML